MTAVRPDASRTSPGARSEAGPDGLAGSTLDRAEIDRFERMAAEWWDPKGAHRPLHAMNPTRVRFIRDQAAHHFQRDTESVSPLAGLSLLDVGCGGGLVCEPMARLGAQVSGIDAGAETIAIAEVHGGAAGLAIDYACTTAEDLAATGARFDIVTALEIVEHVADVDRFCQALSDLVRPGGLLVMSTLNRTARSFATVIVGAEYVLRWLPRGTHSWRKFLRPSELSAALRPHGFEPRRTAGLRFDPLHRTWSLHDRDLQINYLLAAIRQERPGRAPARRFHETAA